MWGRLWGRWEKSATALESALRALPSRPAHWPCFWDPVLFVFFVFHRSYWSTPTKVMLLRLEAAAGVCYLWLLNTHLIWRANIELSRIWLSFSAAWGVFDPVGFGDAPQLGLENKMGSTSSLKLEELWSIPQRTELLDLGWRMMWLHQGVTSHNNYIAVFS